MNPKKFSNKIWLVVLAFVASLLGAAALFGGNGGVAPYRFPVRAGEGGLESSVDFYLARVQQAPDSALDHSALAAAYMSLGQRRGDSRWFEKAEKSARESLRLLPFFNKSAQLVLADLAQARHRFGEAVEIANALLRDSPDNEGALAVLIKSHLALGQTARAQPLADRLVALAPRSGAFLLRALVQEQSGRPDAALADFRRAYAAEDLGDPEAAARFRALWGRFHLRRGELRPARSLLLEALRLSPDSALVQGLLGDLEARKGHWRAAEGYYADAYRVSGLPLYLLAQAEVRQTLGDRPGAEAYWARAEELLRASLRGGEFGHRRELAALLLARGRGDEIQEALELMRAEFRLRRDPETLALLFEAYLRANSCAPPVRK